MFPLGRTRTKDKYRVVYSDHQRLELEKEFHYSRYITIRRKAELAQALNLSERQVSHEHRADNEGIYNILKLLVGKQLWQKKLHDLWFWRPMSDKIRQYNEEYFWTITKVPSNKLYWDWRFKEVSH